MKDFGLVLWYNEINCVRSGFGKNGHAHSKEDPLRRIQKRCSAERFPPVLGMVPAPRRLRGSPQRESRRKIGGFYPCPLTLYGSRLQFRC